MIGRTLPYSIALVGVAFLLSFIIGIGIGMVAAWRRGGTVDTFFVPTLMGLGAFPAFFTALLGVYFLGLKLGWFPIQHAYDSQLTPGFNWAFTQSAVRHAELPVLVIMAAFTRRLGAEHAHRDDQHDQRGLRRDGAGEGPEGPPGDDPLRGPERDPAAAERVRRAVRRRRRRRSSSSSTSSATRVRASRCSRRRSGSDYPLTQGLLLVFAFAVIAANFLMDLANFLLDPRVRAD